MRTGQERSIEKRKKATRRNPLRERLGLRGVEVPLDPSSDPGTVATILAYLFALGGVLLFGTLLLPAHEGRDVGELVAVGVAAIVVAAGLFVGHKEIPLRVLRLLPALGTVLIGLVVYFGGAEAAAAYGSFMSWVLVAAGMFFDLRLILQHGAFVVVVYAVALIGVDAPDETIGLRLAMTVGTVLAFALVMGGIGRRVRAVLSRLETAAHTDPLTGLLNRRALDQAFERELGRAERTAQPVGVVILDIDGFKRFNDERGHLHGDRALQRLGRVLGEKTRAEDCVARIGGEEFAIIAPDCDTAGALALAERLRRGVEVEFGEDGLTASCGVASHPEGGATPPDLIAAADMALYRAKASGRNRALAAL
jgi:diguanylate cyclase (GGDEF)-like protein